MADENNNSLVKPVKLGSFIKPVGIRGARAEGQAALARVKVEDVPNKFGIIFDDSGSMGTVPLENAKKAVAGFLSSCSPLDTAVAIYDMGYANKPMTNDFDLINLWVMGLKSDYGTPLYSVLDKMLEQEKISRGIVFSDGQPTDATLDETTFNEYGEVPLNNLAVRAVNRAVESKTPIDTVYIGDGDSHELQLIAKLTGGQYLKFDDTASFAKGLKYLAPKYYALLTNPDVKAKIERGESI